MLNRFLSFLDVRPQFEATQSLTGIGVGRVGAVLQPIAQDECFGPACFLRFVKFTY
jgi:hypothetical protein